MANTNSFHPNPGKGITRVMRRVFGVSVPATVALSAVAAVIFAVALDGCSTKTSKKETSPSKSSEQVSAQSSATPIAYVKDEPMTTKKPSVVKRVHMVSYSDSGSGVSFRYPREYTLVTPAKAKQNSGLLDRVAMNFVQPGGVRVATIELPDNDATSLLGISLNRTLTSQQCEQFADPDLADIKGNTRVSASDDSIPSKVNVHGLEFMRVEKETEQTDTRYYHRYENGACYEFVLAVAEKPGNTKVVDHFQRFNNMELVLASVKTKSETPALATAGVPASTNESKPQ